MKLRNQILCFGLLAGAAAALSGGIGLLSTQQQSAALDQVVGATLAVRAGMDADMMHDAIRGDVMAAMVAAQRHEADGVKEAQKSLAEHRKRFEESLVSMQAQPLPPEARQALDAALPLTRAYGDNAGRVLQQAAGDADAAQAMLPAFAQACETLETKMEALGDAMEKHAQAIGGSAHATARRAQLWICLVAAAGLAMVAAGALLLAGRVTRPMQHAVDVAERIAGGDLSGAITPHGNAESARLLDSLARMQQSFGEMVQSVRANAQGVASASAEISSGNNDLSSRTEQQASALEETAASMEQLNATVRQNAENARTADQLAHGASDVARQGGTVVGEVVQTMKGINDSSKKIADIIGVIDGIAFQTNILALNAAVEAARAGEQGRGFAVVAAEVRSLAGRSADAAKQIKGLIQTSVERVDQGTRLVDRAGVTMQEIVDAIARVTSLMGEISSASAQQSAGAVQVGEAVTQMDRSTQQNAALVEESAAAAESLRIQAQELVSAIARFRLVGDADEAGEVAETAQEAA